MSSRFGSRTDSGIIRDFIESYDGDAANYFRANTAITSDADKNAINTFYLGLKSDGIYTKIKAMYLPIWGSAASCKWNLVNPLDTDAAFRLTFSTGLTYSSSGITGNGTSSYINTYFNMNGYRDSNHGIVYVQTNLNGGYNEYGAATAVNVSVFANGTNNANICYTQNHVNNSFLSYSNTNGSGLYVNKRESSTSGFKTFRNGVLKATDTNSIGNQIPHNIYLFARNVADSSIIAYSSNKDSFFCFGNGLTDTEVTNISSRINTLMTYFGINVY